MRDANNAVTTLRLGSNGQMLQMNDALGRLATFNYDTNFNLVRLIGPTGESTEMNYDSQGNVSSILNPLGQTVSLNSGGYGRLGQLQDARGQQTGFGYDPHGNLTAIGYADASAERFGYDPAGNLITWTNRRGQAIQFIRNSAGQPTRKLYPDGRTLDYAHDARGLLTNVTDSVQGVTRMLYDQRSFLTNLTYPDGKGFTFSYNAAGHRTRRAGHDGYTLLYGYDGAGRLQSLSNNVSGLEVSYLYDSAGQLIRENKGNGTYTTYTYDLAGQVLALTNCAPNGVAQSFFNYTYDLKGNRLTMTTAAGATSYGYDALNQLTSVTYPGGRHVTYAYDAAGNRITVSDNGTNTVYSANILNQYTQAGAASFGYDNDGNLISRSDLTGITTYQYDAENRLTQVTTPTNGVFQYAYDALGNRTTVTHNGTTTRHLHDPVGLVDVAAEYDVGGTLVARYDHALGLVARADSGGNTAFYSFDALGNTREITGTGGAVLNAYDYDAFGAAKVVTEAMVNPFKFVGQLGVTEEGTQLHFMRARSFTSELGRFIAKDPLNFSGGDLNLYGYAQNQPVQFVDPLGTTTLMQARHMLTTMLRNNNPDDRKIQRANHYFENRLNMGGSEDLATSLVKAAWWTSATVAWAVVKNDIIFVNATFNLDIRPNHLRIGKFGFNETEERNHWIYADWGEVGAGLWGVWDGLWEFDPPKLFLPQNVIQYLNSANSSVVRPRDPNDKIAPAGVGPNHVVPAQDEMDYMIRFENFATASAPVQELIVVDYLDANFDWSTVKFKEIAYGGRILVVTNQAQTFNIRDVPPTNSPAVTGVGVASMVVNASGTFNSQIGRFECRLTAMDTNTSYYPVDALTGFLPPENGSGGGQGYVCFSVKLKAATPIGTSITNIASIVFDGNEAIATPAVWNVIGDIPSLSATIAYLPGQITGGIPFTYTVGLTNSGTNAVTNVVMTNALPSGFGSVSNYVTIGAVTEANGILTWNVGTLTNGADARWFITVLPSHSGTFTNNLFYSGGSGLAIYTTPGVITVLPSATPVIGIQSVGSQIQLTWPTNATGFRLQSSAAVGASVWGDVTNTATTVAGYYQVTVSPSGVSRYFRLVNH